MHPQTLQDQSDLREAQYNDRAVGPACQIQLPVERITKLHGIVFDLDPALYAPDNSLFPPAADPTVFYSQIVAVLNRHPLCRFAEVRASGTGLHLLLTIEPAVELRSAGEQEYWSAAVRLIQTSMPIDPDMPGITAVTRPVGSLNTKNGAEVKTLKAGNPVPRADVDAYLERVAKTPFREIALPILGDQRVYPCPLCRKEGTHLDVLDLNEAKPASPGGLIS